MKENNIKYSEEQDISKMLSLGIDHVPVVKIDDKLYSDTEAIQYIRNWRVK